MESPFKEDSMKLLLILSLLTFTFACSEQTPGDGVESRRQEETNEIMDSKGVFQEAQEHDTREDLRESKEQR